MSRLEFELDNKLVIVQKWPICISLLGYNDSLKPNNELIFK
jgi:hypothetical protein